MPILCSARITKTNMGLKVLNYLSLTLTDFPPQAMFARRLMLRVKLLDDEHFSRQIFYNTFLCSKFVDCSVLTWQHLQFAFYSAPATKKIR